MLRAVLTLALRVQRELMTNCYTHSNVYLKQLNGYLNSDRSFQCGCWSETDLTAFAGRTAGGNRTCTERSSRESRH